MAIPGCQCLGNPAYWGPACRGSGVGDPGAGEASRGSRLPQLLSPSPSPQPHPTADRAPGPLTPSRSGAQADLPNGPCGPGDRAEDLAGPRGDGRRRMSVVDEPEARSRRRALQRAIRVSTSGGWMPGSDPPKRRGSRRRCLAEHLGAVQDNAGGRMCRRGCGCGRRVSGLVPRQETSRSLPHLPSAQVNFKGEPRSCTLLPTAYPG